MSDSQRESEISRFYQILIASKDAKSKRIAQQKMTELINGRSDNQIRKMEKEKGLA